MKGVMVTDPAPQKMTGGQVHAQIDALVVPMQKDNPKKGKRKNVNPKKDNPNKDRFVGYGVEHMWTHKPGLERLPYFNDLLLPHNIDVMHTEKNVTEALWATLMDIPDKTKDNPIMKNIRNTCNTMLFCNDIFFFLHTLLSTSRLS